MANAQIERVIQVVFNLFRMLLLLIAGNDDIQFAYGIGLPWISIVHFTLFKVFMPSYVTVNNGAEEKSLTIENLCLKCIKDKPCKQVNLSRCFANIPLMLVLIDPSSLMIVYDLFEEPMGQLGAVPTMCLLLSLPSLHPFLFSRTHGS